MKDRVFLLIVCLGLLLGPTGTLGQNVQGDIVFKREGNTGGTPPAVFQHWFHRIRYKCYACHPTPFKMKAGANKITMEMIQGGKACGVCHNGNIAWAVSFANCTKCHIPQK